jgi:hypothetical protein
MFHQVCLLLPTEPSHCHPGLCQVTLLVGLFLLTLIVCHVDIGCCLPCQSLVLMQLTRRSHYESDFQAVDLGRDQVEDLGN